MTSTDNETGHGALGEPFASDLRAVEWELSEVARRIEAIRQQLQTIRERPEALGEADDHPGGAL